MHWLIIVIASLQFGNTCYCNSVLQALFFCRPFRERVLGYKPLSKRKESLLTCLADLFGNIASQKKKVGVLAPKKFVARLRKENGKLTYGNQQLMKPAVSASRKNLSVLYFWLSVYMWAYHKINWVHGLGFSLNMLLVKVNRSVYKCVRRKADSYRTKLDVCSNLILS